ncbi:hypothetical protein ACOZ4I_02360 [Haloarcula salina]|uniref:hypothetical protein n=1 Tax=Haloarcula salina TaxID=1429914 RepID=UPI003C6EECDE
MNVDEARAMFDTPVAVTIFKRTEPLERLLDVVRKVEPPEMYIVGDGPRDEIEGEAAKVEAARSLAEESINWDCEVYTNYADENLGGPIRYPTGLDWVFENTEEAVLFEDDHLPSIDFFPYCQELLERYRDTPEVMGICGNNAGVPPDIDASYFFSNHHRSMGWATWRSAWKKYDPDMEAWPEVRENGVLEERYHIDDWAEHHDEILDIIYDDDDERNYCDVIWHHSLVANRGMTIMPKNNLVIHTGFGDDSMHNEVTPHLQQRFLLPSRRSLSFPLEHPERVEPSAEFDRRYYKYKRGEFQKIIGLVDRAIHKMKTIVGYT